MRTKLVVLLATLAITWACRPVRAELVRVTFENVGESDYSLTPLWFGFHDGGFDYFDAGSAANLSLEALAEEGDVSGLAADFTAMGNTVGGVITAPGGFAGAPVVEPMETGFSAILDFDTAQNRFFSFASMVIPSNDTFLGNDTATEIFDASGAFLGGLSGSRTIDVLGNQLWDAGTEVNDPNGGAAFSANGGTSTDENGIIQLQNLVDLNDDYLGTLDLRGMQLQTGINPDTVVARITISAVPEPSASAFALCAALAIVRRRLR